MDLKMNRKMKLKKRKKKMTNTKWPKLASWRKQ